MGTIDAHWIPSLDAPRFSNGTLRGTFRADTQGTTVGYLLRANEETFTDYGFYGSTSSAPSTSSGSTMSQTIIAMADPAQYPFVAGETYNVQASVVGHKIEMKAWKVGDPEPSSPMLSVTDKGLKPDSGSAICVLLIIDPVPLKAAGVTEVQVSGTFDDITFMPGADTLSPPWTWFGRHAWRSISGLVTPGVCLAQFRFQCLIAINITSVADHAFHGYPEDHGEHGEKYYGSGRRRGT